MTRRRNRRSPAHRGHISGEPPANLLSIAEADDIVSGWLRLHGDGLRLHCRQYGLRESDIDDALQEIYIVAVQAVRRNKPIPSPGGWLRAVADTRCYRVWQQRSKDERLFEGRDRIYDPPGRCDDGEDAAIRHEKIADVRKAIASLGHRERAVVVERMWSETWEEAAANLKISVDAARARHNRAKKKLKRLLMAKYG